MSLDPPYFNPAPTRMQADAVRRNIEFLRRFVTHEALQKAQAAELQRYSKERLLDPFFMIERQPMLALFRLYDRITMNGARRPTEWPNHLISLARLGLIAKSVTRGMPPKVQHDHRTKLLCINGQHLPLAHEWEQAYYFSLRSWPVRWYDTEASPEFEVTSPAGVFDVECTRFGSNLFDRLKNDSAQTLVEGVIECFTNARMYGTISVTALTATPPNPSNWQSSLCTALRLASPSLDWTLDGQLHIVGTALPVAGIATVPFDPDSAIEGIPPGSRCCVLGIPDAGNSMHMLKIELGGPRMSPEEQFKCLLDRMLEKTGPRKFDGTRAGMLSIEIDGIDEASIFSRSDAIDGMRKAVFDQRPHVIGIAYRATSRYYVRDRQVKVLSETFFGANASSKFPELAAVAMESLKGTPTRSTRF